MEELKISVNKDREEKKPTKRRGRPKKVAKKALVKTKISEVKTRTKQATISKSSRKKGGLMPTLIAVIVTGILVGGSIYAWQSRSGKKDINDAERSARQARMDFDQRLSQLKNKLTGVETENQSLKDSTKELEERVKLLDGAKKDFSNDEIGITFSYPAIFGEVEIAMIDGARGKKFEANFSKNDKLVFGGVNVDYLPKASSTDVDFIESQGYYMKKDKFYFQAIGKNDSTDIEIVPNKKIGKSEQVLLLNQDSFIIKDEENIEKDAEEIDDNKAIEVNTEPSVKLGENLGAIVNLEVGNFRGVTFLNQDSGMLPSESFEKILESIIIHE